MKIKNRMPDIMQFLTEVVRDFFSMEILRLFEGQNWKAALMQSVENGYAYVKARYAGAYEKIQHKGLDNYEVSDMDATVMLAVLEDWDRVYSRRSRSINNALDTLRYDRNNDSHPSGIETDSQLRESAFGILHDIRRFVISISKEPIYQRYGFQDFSDKTMTKLDEWQQCIDMDFADVIREEECLSGMNRDIVDILNSKDPMNAWHRMLNDKYLNDTYLRDGTYRRFLITSANAGIQWAESALGDFYFSGMPKAGIAPEYSKAAECYQKMRAAGTLGIFGFFNLASIYANSLADGHTPEEGKHMLESCGTKYTTYESSGYTFYYPVSSKQR